MHHVICLSSCKKIHLPAHTKSDISTETIQLAVKFLPEDVITSNTLEHGLYGYMFWKSSKTF